MPIDSDPIARFEQALRELPAAPAARSGVWTLAQTMTHCAQSIEYSLPGYPKLRSGFFRAAIGSIVRRKFLRAGRMSHDATAPVPGAPPITEVTVADARQRVLDALAAFRRHDRPLAPHLAYGVCSKQEYAALHLLHFEDHVRAWAS